jgi:hypothetical protein
MHKLKEIYLYTKEKQQARKTNMQEKNKENKGTKQQTTRWQSYEQKLLNKILKAIFKQIKTNIRDAVKTEQKQ